MEANSFPFEGLTFDGSGQATLNVKDPRIAIFNTSSSTVKLYFKGNATPLSIPTNTFIRYVTDEAQISLTGPASTTIAVCWGDFQTGTIEPTGTQAVTVQAGGITQADGIAGSGGTGFVPMAWDFNDVVFRPLTTDTSGNLNISIQGQAAAISVTGAGSFDPSLITASPTTLGASQTSAVVDANAQGGFRDATMIVTAVIANYTMLLEGSVDNQAGTPHGWVALITFTNSAVNTVISTTNTNRVPYRYFRFRRSDANAGNVTVTGVLSRG